MTDSPCCFEHNCRRKQPVLLRRAPLCGRWAVLTRYTRKNGRIESSEKHWLDEETSKSLDEAFGYTEPELEAELAEEPS